ncbi:hypothetical protein BDF14DRAFT_1831340 [Spinellus fusiger]|nr:hypothetical protein BDF14DRAFT_1831340 [Spinellus fusiger]
MLIRSIEIGTYHSTLFVTMLSAHHVISFCYPPLSLFFFLGDLLIHSLFWIIICP